MSREALQRIREALLGAASNAHYFSRKLTGGRPCMGEFEDCPSAVCRARLGALAELDTLSTPAEPLRLYANKVIADFMPNAGVKVPPVPHREATEMIPWLLRAQAERISELESHRAPLPTETAGTAPPAEKWSAVPEATALAARAAQDCERDEIVALIERRIAELTPLRFSHEDATASAAIAKGDEAARLLEQVRARNSGERLLLPLIPEEWRKFLSGHWQPKSPIPIDGVQHVWIEDPILLMAPSPAGSRYWSEPLPSMPSPSPGTPATDSCPLCEGTGRLAEGGAKPGQCPHGKPLDADCDGCDDDGWNAATKAQALRRRAPLPTETADLSGIDECIRIVKARQGLHFVTLGYKAALGDVLSELEALRERGGKRATSDLMASPSPGTPATTKEPGNE